MSISLNAQRVPDWQKQAQAEMNRHFGDELKQSPVNGKELERLEQNLAVLALAANLSAIKPPDKIIEMDDGTNWYKSMDLMRNISLCHRPVPGGNEYAVAEYFSGQDINEIWNRGGNAMEVLRSFIQEQQQALKIWTDDMTKQLTKFLLAKYPGRDSHRLAHDFMDRFMTGQFAGEPA